jgi:hypothetical protein
MAFAAGFPHFVVTVITSESSKLQAADHWLATQLLDLDMVALMAESNDALVAASIRSNAAPLLTQLPCTGPPERGTLALTLHLLQHKSHHLIPIWAEATQLIVFVLSLSSVQEYHHNHLASLAEFLSLRNLVLKTRDWLIRSLFPFRRSCVQLDGGFSIYTWSYKGALHPPPPPSPYNDCPHFMVRQARLRGTGTKIRWKAKLALTQGCHEKCATTSVHKVLFAHIATEDCIVEVTPPIGKTLLFLARSDARSSREIFARWDFICNKEPLGTYAKGSSCSSNILTMSHRENSGTTAFSSIGQS